MGTYNAEYHREYYQQKKLQDPEAMKLHSFTSNLKFKFKMTPEQYDEKLEEQNGRCAVCACLAGSTRCRGKRLVVDHDRACCPGKRSCGECIRALLCWTCNITLGHMSDNPDLLVAAAAYLVQHQGGRK